MDLTGQEYEQLEEALLGAFRSAATLRQMVRFRLGKHLDAIAIGSNLRQIIFALVETSQAEGWTAELIVAARMSNPGNAKLFAFAQQVGLAIHAPTKKELENSFGQEEAEELFTKLGEAEYKICRIEMALNGKEPHLVGRGLLLGPDVLITSYDVMAPVIKNEQGGKLSDVILRFDHVELNGEIISHGREYYLAQQEWLIDSQTPNEPKYILLRVNGKPGNEPIGQNLPPNSPRRGWVSGKESDIPPSPPYPLVRYIDSSSIELQLLAPFVFKLPNGNRGPTPIVKPSIDNGRSRQWSKGKVVLLLSLIALAVFGYDCWIKANPTEISIIYAPEEEGYVTYAMGEFNDAYSGEEISLWERPIVITGTPGSSGEVAQGIANAIKNQRCPKWRSQETLTPTIYSPSVRHWLALVNYCTGQTVFDSSEEGSSATARAPVVIAIWESRLEAIKAKNKGEPIGWEELLEVLNSPNGWTDYGIESGHQTVYYGHTDPFVSSTALSTLIAEFNAIANTNGEVGILKLDEVTNSNVQKGVRGIELLIRHYAPQNTEFINYIAQGPDYLDFVALEENDLIKINRGKASITPPEKLVALYPKEGTFWHDHPFAIPNARWVSDEQQEAAKAFTEFVRSETVQQKVLASGFRPVIELEAMTSTDPNINPIVPDLGVNLEQPTAILRVPEPQVIAEIQASWPNVKKQADVILAIDTSASMEGDKLMQAQKAAENFLLNMSGANRVALIDFDSTVKTLAPLDSIEDKRKELVNQINELKADGETALYDTIVQATQMLTNARSLEDDHIQAIILLSDGVDTTSQNKIEQVGDLINQNRNDRNPIVVIPIAYGSNADIETLEIIAEASSTLVQFGNLESIEELLKILSGYF